MTVLFNPDSIINNIINDFGSNVYFILVSSKNGAVMKLEQLPNSLDEAFEAHRILSQ